MSKEAIIEIMSLRYAYPDGTLALEDIDLTIGRGETVGIVGPNGAGKSTLLLHLNGLLRGTGTVRVMGMEIDGKNLREIRRAVGLVFQDPEDQLFTPTVYDDVAFGPLNMRYPSSDIDARVKKALEIVDMSGFENRSSHHLSFGEKKKISLATVLALDPPIIALDEPTSNLDPKSREEFIRYLHGLGATKIIATHDLDMVVEVCERTLVLCAGRIVGDGQTEGILGNGDLMERNGLKVPLMIQLRRTKDL
jgi:cobalt/nickel transport system ATP-binding protein